VEQRSLWPFPNVQDGKAGEPSHRSGRLGCADQRVPRTHVEATHAEVLNGYGGVWQTPF
jgi:hypothetical protein